MQVTRGYSHLPQTVTEEPPYPEAFCNRVGRVLSGIADILCWIWEQFVYLLTCSCTVEESVGEVEVATTTLAPPQPQPTPTTTTSSATASAPQPPTPPSPPAEVASVLPAPSVAPLNILDLYREGLADFFGQNTLANNTDRFVDAFLLRIAPYHDAIIGIECMPADINTPLRYRFHHIKVMTERAADIARALAIGPQIRGDIATRGPAEDRSGEVVVNLDYIASLAFCNARAPLATPSSLVAFKETFKEFLIQSTFLRDQIYTIADIFFEMLASYEDQVENIDFIITGASGNRNKSIRITTRSEEPPAGLINAFRALPEWAAQNAVTSEHNQIVLNLFGTMTGGHWYNAFIQPQLKF